ncbi:hypothetical protein FQA47_020130 [Oryzias melastigma]|uniref:Uncharacterized protein n=1 Tax=Oryzias melastigma TaxID=30732 RepID=A0A834FVY3_ORYME|nr:hypothetical protein FQA47_020130 [Oryzias melastigma]
MKPSRVVGTFGSAAAAPENTPKSGSARRSAGSSEPLRSAVQQRSSTGARVRLGPRNLRNRTLLEESQRHYTGAREASSSPAPYLSRGDAARTVRRVGGVVEDSVPVQRPQPDVRQEEESGYEQPRDLQQPLLLPPHGSGGRVQSGGDGGKSGSETRLYPDGGNFHSGSGDGQRRCDAHGCLLRR